MNIALWLLQVVLAAAFLAHGGFMVAPPAEMVAMMNAVFTPGFRLFIGVAEVLAAIGLIAPATTRIMPWLTICAAAGLMLVTASATVFHVTRGEGSSAITTTILLALVTLVAYGRWKVKPIAARHMRLSPVLARSS